METYFYDDMICCKCRRRYTISTQAETYASAVRIFKQIQFGYFNNQTKTLVKPIPCGNCTGPREIDGIEPSQAVKSFKPVYLTVQDGHKIRQAKQGEVNASKASLTLQAIQNNTFKYEVDPNPDFHVQQCECKVCYSRKAQALRNSLETEGAYNQALIRLGLREWFERKLC